MTTSLFTLLCSFFVLTACQQANNGFPTGNSVSSIPVLTMSAMSQLPSVVTLSAGSAFSAPTPLSSEPTQSSSRTRSSARLPSTGRGGCKTSGCSGQVCIDATAEDVITTCEMRPEYACYRQTRCERQADGRCGWTMTPEVRSCIQNAQGQEPNTWPQ